MFAFSKETQFVSILISSFLGHVKLFVIETQGCLQGIKDKFDY